MRENPGYLSPNLGFLSPNLGFLSANLGFLSANLGFLSNLRDNPGFLKKTQVISPRHGAFV